MKTPNPKPILLVALGGNALIRIFFKQKDRAF